MNPNIRTPPVIEALFVPKAIHPTDEQNTIRIAIDRTIVVEANAGAAKTTTLALRMAESLRRGTPPELFLALPCTQTACETPRYALKKIGVPYTVVGRFRIQTFESFCQEVLDEI